MKGLLAILACVAITITYLADKEPSNPIPYRVDDNTWGNGDGSLNMNARSAAAGVDMPAPKIWSQMTPVDEAHLVAVWAPRSGNTDDWSIPVRVDRPGQEVLLVLVSEQPVKWIVSPEPNTEISGVIVTGANAAYSKIEINAGQNSNAIPTWKGYEPGHLPIVITKSGSDAERLLTYYMQKEFGLRDFQSRTIQSRPGIFGFVIE